MNPTGQRRGNPWLRWLNVFVRSVHLAAVIGLGAALLGAPLSPLRSSLSVLVSGMTLLALDLWGKPRLLLEWSGAALVLKLLAVAGLVLFAEFRPFLFWVVVVWSAVFAHAPASFRHGSWRRHGVEKQ